MSALCLVVAFISVSLATTADDDCLVDIVFLVDGSSSITQQFNITLQYVEQITNVLDIRPDAHRVALLEYSGQNRIIKEYGFDNFTSLDQFKTRLLGLPHMTGTTYTARALERVLLVLNGRRPNVRSVVVTVTDGFSFDDTAPVVAKIAALGTELFAFSVNEPYTQNELLILTNGIKENVFHLPNAVESARSRLGPYLRCDDAAVNCSVSLVIAVDASGRQSVLFDQYKAAATEFINGFTTQQPADIAFLTFAEDVDVHVNMTANTSTLLKLIADSKFVPGSRNVGQALKAASSELRGSNTTGGSEEAVILFSNGFSCDDPAQYVQELRARGIAVYVISLSNAAVKQSELSSISNHLFKENEIHALIKVLRADHCNHPEDSLMTSTASYDS